MPRMSQIGYCGGPEISVEDTWRPARAGSHKQAPAVRSADVPTSRRLTERRAPPSPVPDRPRTGPLARIHLIESLEPGTRDSVSPVHQPSIRGQDHRKPEIGVGDPARMFGHLSARRRPPAAEPAILVELHDVRERHLQHRQTPRRRPQTLHPPIPPGHPRPGANASRPCLMLAWMKMRPNARRASERTLMPRSERPDMPMSGRLARWRVRATCRLEAPGRRPVPARVLSVSPLPRKCHAAFTRLPSGPAGRGPTSACCKCWGRHTAGGRGSP
jgi:hypothetical protein